ncbi:MAG: hypothetical protein ABI574_00850 [Burkholderiales bacterium]
MSTEQQLGIVLARLDALTGDMSEVRTSTRDLAAAVNRLVLVEDRQINASQALDRAFVEIRRHDERLHSLEMAQPLQKQSSDLVRTIVGWVVSLAVGAGVAQLFNKPAIPDRPRQPAAEQRP